MCWRILEESGAWGPGPSPGPGPRAGPLVTTAEQRGGLELIQDLFITGRTHTLTNTEELSDHFIDISQGVCVCVHVKQHQENKQESKKN